MSFPPSASFLVLGGGAAVAAGVHLPKNSVGTRALKPEAVTGAKVKPARSPAIRLRKRRGPVTPKPESDSARRQPSTTNGSSYSKAESDGRYLKGTITVSASIPPVATDSFQTGLRQLPGRLPGDRRRRRSLRRLLRQSVGVGSELQRHASARELGPAGPATGWVGAISTQGSATGVSGASTITVICSPIG